MVVAAGIKISVDPVHRTSFTESGVGGDSDSSRNIQMKCNGKMQNKAKIRNEIRLKRLR